MPAKLVKVAVNVPLSREFDYLPGGHLPPAGARVRVPFGRRESVGLVLGHGDDATVSRDKLKRIDEVVDETPLLGEDELWLIRFCASY